MLARLGAIAAALSLAAAGDAPPGGDVGKSPGPDLDRRVQAFLDQRRGSWNALNVPYQDGKVLHDLVLRSGARRILEVGTSTGHSTIWLAWAAARTGGKVVTIEIDPERHAAALKNLEAAGVARFVEARLGDAHELVRTLPGPWDFVFQDADKDWYLRYWVELAPRMAPGGCYTAHNVLRPHAPEVREFIDAAQADGRFETRFAQGTSGEGILVACRRVADR
jgi:predicted O-methyltransferase YrrM